MGLTDIEMTKVNGTVPKNTSRINIQSSSHEKLLNVIDELRCQGISRFIDLPQLIVCGDQSSGKSSVLEAVSGLQFPTKDALCTRFATELILRRNPEITSTVTIVPDANRPDSEKARLSAFKCDKSVFKGFDKIIDDAGKEMGLEGTSKVFSSDVLRIELSGPSQPHLTLVDLPGLFHSGSKAQSDTDAEAVKTLVTGYMKKSRSIILAVVSAKNDYNNQIVTKYARDFDADGERTLGIITKPDTLPSGSDSEKQYVELAENKDVQFRLGWHVLKNRDYDQRNFTAAERDESEAKFFNKGIWTSLSPAQLGIGSLRPRLSRVLQGQILSELPNLISDVQKGIRECEGRLERLGTSRGTKQEQRMHLHSVSEAFTTLIKNAVGGYYESDYFGDAATKLGYQKRIRAVTSNMLEQFAADIRLKGRKYEVVKDPPATQTKTYPFKVSKQARLTEVSKLLRRNRGKELSNFSKDENITTLFREQCSPWKNLVETCADEIFDAVKNAVIHALTVTSDAGTKDGIMSCIVNPALDKIKVQFDAATKKTLKHHNSGHPITYNHYLTENIQKARAQHNEEHMGKRLKEYFGVDPFSNNTVAELRQVDVKSLLKALTASNEADMTLFACSEALHVMEAYYKVAQKFFIDDFAISAVEQALLEKIPEIFSPSTILTLDEDLIEDIAGETDESKVERASSTAKLETLKAALDVLKRLDRGQTRTLQVNEAKSQADDTQWRRRDDERGWRHIGVRKFAVK